MTYSKEKGIESSWLAHSQTHRWPTTSSWKAINHPFERILVGSHPTNNLHNPILGSTQVCVDLASIKVLAPLLIRFAVFMVHLATVPIAGTGIDLARSLGARGDRDHLQQWQRRGTTSGSSGLGRLSGLPSPPSATSTSSGPPHSRPLDPLGAPLEVSIWSKFPLVLWEYFFNINKRKRAPRRCMCGLTEITIYLVRVHESSISALIFSIHKTQILFRIILIYPYLFVDD